MITITLPFPPSVNRMWRQYRGRAILSKAGRDYRKAAIVAAYGLGTVGGDQCAVSIRAYLPDARRRDCDNLTKAPLDALAHAGVYLDDSQIVRLTIEKAGIDRKAPRLEITVEAA